jgi:hypothetical protein
MIITPARSLEGIVETLQRVIIPELSSPYARGQAFAAVSLLEGLSARWGRVEQLYAMENRQLASLLKLFVGRSSHLGKGKPRIQALRRRIVSVSKESRSEATDYVALRNRNILLRSLLNEVLVYLDEDGIVRRADDLRRRIRRHLKHELKRELRLAVSSKMKEVSKG